MTSKKPSPIPAVLMLGAVSQIGQVLLLRELFMVFQGNELSLGIILAAWMGWVGIGSFLGAFLAERASAVRLVGLLRGSAAGVLILLPLTLIVIRRLRGFFNVLPGAYLSLIDMAVSCFLVTAPVCLLAGAQFVLLTRVWRERDGTNDSSGAGKTYVGEAAGNLAGGILFTFFMVRWLNPFQSAVIAAALMFAAIMQVSRRTQTAPLGQRLKVMAVLPVLFVLSFPLLRHVDQWAYRGQWRQFMPEHRLAEIRHSKHGTISIVEREGQYSFFQSGHLIFSTAGPASLTAGLEEQDAVTFAHFSMLQHENPRRILLIGGGLRGTLGEIARYPVERIDYIELDEVLTGAALPYVSAATRQTLSDPRVRAVHTDGRFFVKAAAEKYDLIIVDVPDPATAVLNRYYTREFFREAQNVLLPGGVLVIGAVSTPDMRGAAVGNRNAAIYHTLRSVFARVLPVGERFMFYFAADVPHQVTADFPTLQKRFRRANAAGADFSPIHLQTLLVESQLRRVNWIIRSHGRGRAAHLEGAHPGPLIPPSVAEQERAEAHLPPVEKRWFINSDFRPIGYYYTLMFWENLTRAGRKETFARLLRVDFRRTLPLWFIPLLVVWGLRTAARRPGKRPDIRFAVLFAVFTTGLSMMALQIALLFSFQSIYGFVYETVGLIVAVFMCGLAAGAHFTNRHVKDKTNLNILAGIQLLIAALSAGLAFVIPQAAALKSPAAVFALFSLLTFAAGLVNGVDFPIETACCLALDKRAEKSAGVVYGVELLGACSGAVLAGTVVAPVMGIAACCFLAAAAGGAAFVVLLICRRSYA